MNNKHDAVFVWFSIQVLFFMARILPSDLDEKHVAEHHAMRKLLCC